MSNLELDKKIRDTFHEYAIDKSLIRRLGVSGDDRHVPSYVLDWIVTLQSQAGPNTTTLQKSVQDFIHKHLPAKGEKDASSSN